MATVAVRTKVVSMSTFITVTSCVSDFQMEVVSRKSECGPDACRNGNCADEVNGYTCDCDED